MTTREMENETRESGRRSKPSKCSIRIGDREVILGRCVSFEVRPEQIDVPYLLDLVERQETELAALLEERDAMRAAVCDLQSAELDYRHACHLFGFGSLQAGRAWDLMRLAGTSARATLARFAERKGES